MAVTLLSLFLITELYDIGLMNPCPCTNASIEDRTQALICTGSKRYHCFCGPNGEAVEVCTFPRFIDKEECVIGYTKIRNSDAVKFSKVNCNGSDCPKSEYLSHEVYKYGSCRNLSTEKRSCPVSTNTISSGESTANISFRNATSLLETLSENSVITQERKINDFGTFAAIGLAVAFGIVLLGLSLTTYCKRKRSKKTDKTEAHVEASGSQNERRNNYDDSWEMRDFTRVIRNNETGSDNEMEDDIYDHLKSKRVNLENIICDNY